MLFEFEMLQPGSNRKPDSGDLTNKDLCSSHNEKSGGLQPGTVQPEQEIRASFLPQCPKGML